MCSYDTAAAVAVSAVGVDTLFIISSYPPENPICRVRPCWVDSIAIRTWVQHKNAIGTPSVPSPPTVTQRTHISTVASHAENCLTARRHACIQSYINRPSQGPGEGYEGWHRPAAPQR